MKLKNVKVGQRVELKEPCSNSAILVGSRGTIVEDSSRLPYVDWDNYRVYAVYHDRLRKLKEYSE